MRANPSARPSWRMMALGAALTAAILGLCVSCAPFGIFTKGSSCGSDNVLDVPHRYSQKRADCLSACLTMVLDYYGVQMVQPDTSRPLELIALSHRLNAQTLRDAHGYRVFTAVLQLTPEDLKSHLADGRPVILVYEPHGQTIYHSLVVSGYCPERDRFYVHDPVRRHPVWTKLSRFPHFAETGKYLVLLVGLQEG